MGFLKYRLFEFYGLIFLCIDAIIPFTLNKFVRVFSVGFIGYRYFDFFCNIRRIKFIFILMCQSN